MGEASNGIREEVELQSHPDSKVIQHEDEGDRADDFLCQHLEWGVERTLHVRPKFQRRSQGTCTPLEFPDELGSLHNHHQQLDEVDAQRRDQGGLVRRGSKKGDGTHY